jgi:LmbE family N-acetylglucosaminyl deacetylase
MGRVTEPATSTRKHRTLVFFHAHPDDEASQTAGTMAKAAAQGYRVVVVYGTNGDHGEAPEDLGPGETVVDRRRREAENSARVLGTAGIHWLGYADSGMTGWEQNGAPNAFCNADRDEAAARLAAILDAEDADVLVCYDWHGGYGHPDHIQVHRVGHRAAELAARPPRVLESTMNRDAMRRLRQQALAAAAQVAAERATPDQAGDPSDRAAAPGQAGEAARQAAPDQAGDAAEQAMAHQAAVTGQAGEAADADMTDFDPDAPMDDGNPMGTPEAEIHWQVDVSEFLDRKRQALQAHASQVTDVGFFLAMPPEVFAAAFGTEHYIEPGRPPGMRSEWFLDAPATDGVAVGKDRDMTDASGAGTPGMGATP